VEREHRHSREKDLCPVGDHDGNDGDDHGQHKQDHDGNHGITATRRSPARACRRSLLGKLVRFAHQVGLPARLVLQGVPMPS
jgi:hypothetical protein